jgi:hypothetical protein
LRVRVAEWDLPVPDAKVKARRHINRGEVVFTGSSR